MATQRLRFAPVLLSILKDRLAGDSWVPFRSLVRFAPALGRE
jgi:hypothetical protein